MLAFTYRLWVLDIPSQRHRPSYEMNKNTPLACTLTKASPSNCAECPCRCRLKAHHASKLTNSMAATLPHIVITRGRICLLEGVGDADETEVAPEEGVPKEEVPSGEDPVIGNEARL